MFSTSIRSTRGLLTPLALLLVLCASCRLEKSSGASSSSTSFSGRAFLGSPARWTEGGALFEYQPTLAPELASARIELKRAPAGMTHDAATGLLRWTPGVTQTGKNAMTLAATLAGRVFEQTFEITVVELVPMGSAPVTSGGGRLQTGPVTVDVPAGALSAPATLTVARYGGIDEPIDLPDAAFIGDFYDIELTDASGNVVQPSGELRLTFAYDESSLPAGASESDIVVHVVGEEYEAWAVPAESSVVDTVANTVSVDTPHLSIWTTAVYYVPHFYRELASDGKVSVSYDEQILLDVPSARAYCETILATIQNAKTLAAQAGFRLAEDVTVRVFDIDGGNGYYNALTEVIYIDSQLDAYHLRSTPTHEYFHAVTHLYYSMGAEKISRLNWWFEALGAWFATLAEPDALVETIRAAPGGYLRAHLEDRDKNNAYAKGTFIEFAEERVPDFVRTVFEQNTTLNSTLGSIDALLPLGTGYAEYVAWTIGRYGPGRFRDLDALMTVLPDGAVSYSEYYELDGSLKPSGASSIEDPDPITGVTSLAFDGRSRSAAYRSFLYRANVDPGTSGKQIVARLTAAPLGPDRGWVLAMSGDTLVSTRSLSPDGFSFQRTRGLGKGPGDAIDSVIFVYPDTSDDGGRSYRWELDVSDAPQAAQVELAVPPDRERDSQLRVLPPGGFSLPTIEVDLGADPGAPQWGMVVWTYQRRPVELVTPSWQVYGVLPSRTTTTFGDPNLSLYNSANPGSLGPTYFPPGDLADVDFVRFQVFGCDGGFCSGRGTSQVLYLDGEVDFTFTIDASGIVPINGTEPASVVSLVGTLRNQSSLPLVVNSVVAVVGRGAQAFETELRLPQATPLEVVPPGETRSFRFDGVSLEASSANWGTTQPVRLSIDRANASGIPFGDPNQMPALFFSEVFSDPVSVTIRKPS